MDFKNGYYGFAHDPEFPGDGKTPISWPIVVSCTCAALAAVRPV
jgi:hypothetical protein